MTANYFLVVLGSLAALTIFSSTMSKNPALPLLALHIGASDASIGFIAAISPIPGILVSGVVGAYSDRHGRSQVLFLSLLIFATAPFLYLFVTEVWQLACVRFYHGFATAMFMPVAMAAVADRFPPSTRGQALGTYSSFTMVGRFVAPFAGGALIYYASFTSLYLVIGVTAIAALVLSFLIPWETRAAEVKVRRPNVSTLSALKDVVKERKIMVTSSVEAIQYFAMGAFEAFLPIYMNNVLHFNTLQIGFVMGIQVVSMLLAKPLMGRLSDQRGRVPFITGGLLMGAVTIALMPMATDLWALSILSIGFGLTVAGVTASTSTLVTEIAGSSAHGSSIGVLSSVMDVGHSVGPLVTGLVVGAVSFLAGFSLASVLLIVGAIVFVMEMRTPSP